MKASKPLHDDWTERYRPSLQSELVGNTAARERVDQWVASWKDGTPDKRGLLLVGPPGVGKTTIARAIAIERGWNVIELNASEARNAAAIRKAATSGAVHASLFAADDDQHRTVILLDEVDHMAGRLARISEQKIRDSMSTDQSSPILKGDSGGKAELLNLLKISSQPVILACNDVMRFWGMGAGWRERRDRFLRLCDLVHFKRVADSDLRQVATRLLAAENHTIRGDALERMVMSNAGDLRALIKDLQSMVADGKEELTLDDVDAQIAIGNRDGSLDLFPGLEKLYRATTSQQAFATILQLDKDPDELVAWVSWNNPSVHSSTDSIATKAKTLRASDNALPIRFDNLAYRSWYWSSHLSALSAGVLTPSRTDRRLFLNYPAFLRRGRETWRKSGVLDKLARSANCSKAAARVELYPLVRAIHQNSINPAWSGKFEISRKHGFEADEHVLLTGLNPAIADTKRLVKRYEADFESPPLADLNTEQQVETENREDLPSGQSTLF